MSKALVVLSGGQDSTTALFMAKQSEASKDGLHSISFDYGQRHRRELASAIRIAQMADCKTHEVIFIEDVLQSTSPLIDKTAKLEQYSSAEEMERIIGDRVELTFVPMRNALFLTIAANRAVTLGCDTIWTGVCEADNANYPDCRADFVNAMTRMIDFALGTAHPPIVCAPLIATPKPASVLLALQYPGCYQALGYSHTAYDGSYPPTGRDHATVLRAHAFEQANVPDPLIVRAVLEGELPAYPATANYARHLNELIDMREIAWRNGPEHALHVLEVTMREFVKHKRA